MSRATASLRKTIGSIDPGGGAANDEIAAESSVTSEPAATDLANWIDALALALAARLRVSASGFDRRTDAAPASDPEVMDADQLAAFLGVDRKTVYDYAGRGQIPHRRLGKRLLFSRSAIVAWLGPCKAASREG